ncbi:MAG: membrane protein insertase YidC [Steroidobacteraceae bacterium]|jgi:YidC/Oxa1 family membrane protein insertase
MPNIRVLLWSVLAVILFLNYEAWMRDYQPLDQPADVAAPLQAAPGSAASSAPRASSSLADSIPSAAPAPASSTGTVPASAAAPAANAPTTAIPPAGSDTTAAPTSAAQVRIKTDVFDLWINLKGGELDQADLPAYPLRKDTPNVPVRLLEYTDPEATYVLQTGLTAEGGDSAPNHLAIWSAAASSYELGSGADELRVPLTWTDGHGLNVTKTFVFKRGLYAIQLVYEIHNQGATPRSLAAYSRILRHWERAKRSYFDVETYSFKGPALYNGTKSIDLKVEDSEDTKYSQTVTNGWIASLQHHFVSAIVPTQDQPYLFQLQVSGKEYSLSATGPAFTVAPGGETRVAENLFVGPKLQSQLAATGPKLELTADYGRLTVIAGPLFGLLSWVHGLIGNWGWSIIIVTALIKLIFYPLSQASGRSMAKMRAVSPRMKQIQDTYKDDKEKLGRAMMELYKKEKINPLAGCLPMVVQIPFFISFYWVLLESVEMRQAPFLLWVNDLSARDPYFVLPLFMGAAMFAQFKLNPAPPDPMQAKIMQFMPLVMTAMMAWFPSGLVLYWLTNTVLSIAQQWRVNQVVQAEANKKRS